MKYKLRAKCLQDIVSFIQDKNVVILVYTITKDDPLGEVELEFETGTNMNLMLTLLWMTDKSWVMFRTLQPVSKYTGVPDYDRVIEWPEHPAVATAKAISDIVPTLREATEAIAKSFGYAPDEKN